MKKVKIEKYVDNIFDESFNVPTAFIHILTAILPNSALTQLNQNGFDFESIISASKENQFYQAEACVTEKGQLKKIIITVQ